MKLWSYLEGSTSCPATSSASNAITALASATDTSLPRSTEEPDSMRRSFRKPEGVGSGSAAPLPPSSEGALECRCPSALRDLDAWALIFCPGWN